MSFEVRRTVTPFDSFSVVFKVLAVAGYYKLPNKPKYRVLFWIHQIYRPLSFIIVVIYTLQHLLYILKVPDDLNKFVIGLMFEIPHYNLMLKYLAINLNISRLDKLQDLMNDPIFAANNRKDEHLLKKHTTHMHLLSKGINAGLTVSASLWVINPIVARIQSGHYEIPSYMPFETDSWRGFILGIFLECGPVLWIGYGHLALDCTIATYYAQSVVQLKIIKYNLEHIFDINKNEFGRNRETRYNDVIDKTIYDRFLYYVKRYEKVLWFTNEVNSVFDNAISFQFFTILVEVCLVIFVLSTSPIFSVHFMFYLGFYLAIQTQVFIYCFYGGLVQYESNTVATAAYLGDWVSLSPRFRRLLLIAMARWSLPITPRVKKIVPLSLVTFITITRSAYSLFTVLKTSNAHNSHK